MKLKYNKLNRKIAGYFIGVAIISAMASGIFVVTNKIRSQSYQLSQAKEESNNFKEQFEALQQEDQYIRNEKLQLELADIKETYQNAVSIYEDIVETGDKNQDTAELKENFAETLSLLAEENYDGAREKISLIENKLEEITKAEEEKAKQEAEQLAIQQQEQQQTAQINNQPPSGGYSRQTVQTDIGTYTVDIIATDLSSTKIIVDTASPSDCANDCPVLSLGEYVSRNGAYAGVNGSYFCPASYPSCAGKTNSFDTLLMNKNKTYFNSDNNVYSNVPAVIFGSGYIRFVGASSQWGRDTSIDSMIANQPLLVSGGNNIFAGDSDPKKGVKAGRSFVANKGNTVYIGVVRNASVAEAAKVLSTMGMENALNLDSGGSTALWYGGYKAGPGRNIPNAILFVRK